MAMVGLLTMSGKVIRLIKTLGPGVQGPLQARCGQYRWFVQAATVGDRHSSAEQQLRT
jgi:hypothetical protein